MRIRPSHRPLVLATAAAAVFAASPLLAGTTDNPLGVVANGNITLALKPLFNTNSSGAVTMSTAPGDNTNVYVTTVDGSIYRYNTTTPGVAPTLLLNLRTASAPAYSGSGTLTIGAAIAGSKDTVGASGTFGMTFAPGFSDPTSPGYQKFYTYADEKYTTYSGTNTTFLPPEGISPTHVNIIREWTATPGSNNTNFTVNTAQAARSVIAIGNGGNHNAGNPQFGPDGFLYFTTGDGGGNGNGFSGTITNPTDGFTGSTTVAAISNGQDLSNAMGKMIRIDPFIKAANGTTIVSKTNEALSANGGYFIPTGATTNSPAGNPFVGTTFTTPGKSAPALGEVYAYGFRNPWKFSWDSATNKLFLANVGSHQTESIDIIKNGTNAGWPFFEGAVIGEDNVARTNQAKALDATFTGPAKPGMGANGVILTSYPTRWVSNGSTLQNWTGDGSAAIGGFVYHGAGIPELQGKYLFGDYQFVDGTGDYTFNASTGGALTRNSSRIFYTDPNDPLDVTKTYYNLNSSTGAQSQVDFGVQSFLVNFAPGFDLPNVTANGASPTLLLGFGQDQAGELYALFNNGAVYQIVSSSAVPEPAGIGVLSASALMLLRRRRRI